MLRVKKKPIRLQIIDALGGRCPWPGCRITDPDMLEIDHVYGDGATERRLFDRSDGRHQNGVRFSNTNLYSYILANLASGRYQVLCANHNSRKHAIERCCNKKENRGRRPCPCAA